MSRILVVEDDPAILRGLTDNLAFESYEVLTATDGEAGYHLVHEKRPDLVILDLMLPKLSGCEVCRKVRAEGFTMPIVMLTAQAQEDDRVLGLDLGANDYVTKPFSIRELLARIRAILRQHRDESTARGRFEEEFQSASEVQNRLFPQFQPRLETLDYAACCQPARSVGGDYYDFLTVAPGQLGLVVADVAGKGISAALLMASLHACVRTHGPQFGDHCSEVIAKANAWLYEATGAERFATVFYSVYDDAERRLTYVNAGHPPALLIRGPATDAPVDLRLDSDTPPLGIFPTLVPVQRSVQLAPGDWLLVFTDGLSEALNANGEEFGTEGLLEVLRQNSAATATQMRDAILAEVSGHSDGRPQADDRTLVVARVR